MFSTGPSVRRAQGRQSPSPSTNPGNTPGVSWGLQGRFPRPPSPLPTGRGPRRREPPRSSEACRSPSFLCVRCGACRWLCVGPNTSLFCQVLHRFMNLAKCLFVNKTLRGNYFCMGKNRFTFFSSPTTPVWETPRSQAPTRHRSPSSDAGPRVEETRARRDGPQDRRTGPTPPDLHVAPEDWALLGLVPPPVPEVHLDACLCPPTRRREGGGEGVSPLSFPVSVWGVSRRSLRVEDLTSSFRSDGSGPL